MRRVVSLVPSSTESLLALGADVIACTRFCEQPHLPHVGGTKNPDIDAIAALAPDVVVLDREENRREDAVALTQRGIDLFVSDVTTVTAGIEVVGRLATAAGVPSTVMAPLPAPVSRRLSVVVPIWRRPWMIIGNGTYGASLLDHVGCRVASPDPTTPYQSIDLDQLANLQADAVLVPSEPYDFSDAHLAELRAAAPNLTVARIDGQDLFWWGSRTPGAVERLAAAVSSIVGRPQTA